jgi:uncharacterized protein (DUF305 family)
MSATFRASGLIVTVLTTYALIGCAATSEEPSAVGAGAPVIVPGGPGSAGRTATPGERIGPAEQVSAADVRFAESMIPHHRQALEMTALVEARTTSPEIRRTAAQITLAQRPEIELMSRWLATLGRAVPAAGHTEHAATSGMATLEQLNALRAARGAEFDRRFLELMIRHHQGAVRMAGEQLASGRDQGMRLMAKEVYAGQSIEIARMRAIS